MSNSLFSWNEQFDERSFILLETSASALNRQSLPCASAEGGRENKQVQWQVFSKGYVRTCFTQIFDLRYSNSNTELGSGNKFITVKHISTNRMN